jgi:predicted flap endonuclease-1-like 5' DNA nuclease
MDATTLLPTPRKVLRSLRWSFDLLLWTEDATRRLVCSWLAPFTGQGQQDRSTVTVATGRTTISYGPPAAESGEVAPEAVARVSPSAPPAPAARVAHSAPPVPAAPPVPEAPSGDGLATDDRHAAAVAEDVAEVEDRIEITPPDEAEDVAEVEDRIEITPPDEEDVAEVEDRIEITPPDEGEDLPDVEDGATLLAEGVLPEGVLAAPGVEPAGDRADGKAGDDQRGEAVPSGVPAPSAAENGATAASDEQQGEDDLTVINGIGPRIAERLSHYGVTTFAQLAAWSDDDVARFEEQLPGVQRGKASRDRWVEQARELAGQAGDAGTIDRHDDDLP